MLAAAISPRICSAFSRNEFQNRKIMLLGNRARRCVGLTVVPLFVSRLPRQCGFLSISQPYKPARPVTGRVLLCYKQMMSVPHRKHAYGPPRPMRFEVFTAVTEECRFLGYRPSSYLTGDTLRPRYRAQPVNAL
jgi:hypothetical protein